MIIKNKTTKLLVTILFLLIFPLVQKQWFNLYLFNINDFSFYSILYYLSGIICPSLISLNSLHHYTYYKFNENIIHSKKIIKGKYLFVLVALNLIFLSYLTTYYLYINFDIVSNLFFEGTNLQKPNFFQLCFYISFVAFLLIIRKTRLLIKKLILINFILISFNIWYMQINNINVDDQFRIYKYFGFNDLNLINLFILVVIEIFYFTWSFLSYKNNLSDWIVKNPQKGDVSLFLNIFIFYLFIIIYYKILI